ncbi:MAG: 30S ribosomal protein S20 [Clostridia bacterium]|nr:30S ribosomal protein S20 [Clostridia bacterium]
MPNIKSAKKRVKVIETKTLRNAMIKSQLKTYIKKFESAVAGGNKEEAVEAYKIAVKKLDQACAKGIMHKNNCARKKSKLSLILNTVA